MRRRGVSDRIVVERLRGAAWPPDLAPACSRVRSSEPDLRVEERVHHVDEEVDGDERQRDEQRHALDDRDVLHVERAEEVRAHAVEGEDAFEHDRAAQRVRELQSEHGHRNE